MKVIFDNYEYFDPFSDDKNTYSSEKGKDVAFSEATFKKYIDNRQYLDAANYLALYRFKNPEVQRAHENDIETLKTKGAALSAVYGRISNKDDKANVELFDKVFEDGGLETLNTTNPNSNDYNKCAVELIKAKDNLGKHGKADYSDKIGIVFRPKKRSLFGIDWLREDNPYNIDAFYEQSGFTEKQLANAGIEVIHKDDTTELKFSKSHPLANRILYNVATESDIATNQVTSGILSGLSGVLENSIVGLTSLAVPGRENPNDTSSFSSARAFAPLVVGYTTEDNPVYNFAGGVENHFAAQDLERFKRIIRNAERTSKAAFQKLNLDKKAYSSTAMPWVSDELYQLRQTLSDDDYNKQAKLVAPNIFKAINAIGTGNYRMYSNFNNANDHDETLEELDGISKNKLINIISGAKPSELQVDAMVNNGELGALITVAAKYKQTSAKDTAPEGSMIHPRYQVFIPGLLTKEAQARLNRDTKSRAIMELNNMIDWQYDYTTDDGITISPAIDGNFLIDNEIKTKEDAIKEIDKDIALKQMRRELRYIHTGVNGNLIKAENYENEARIGALAIAAELYSGQIGQMPDNTGRVIINNNIYTINDIFDKNIDMDEINYDTYLILQDIYGMYNKIMDDLDYYNK